jgi:hypothetical protein
MSDKPAPAGMSMDSFGLTFDDFLKNTSAAADLESDMETISAENDDAANVARLVHFDAAPCEFGKLSALMNYWIYTKHATFTT